MGFISRGIEEIADVVKLTHLQRFSQSDAGVTRASRSGEGYPPSAYLSAVLSRTSSVRSSRHMLVSLSTPSREPVEAVMGELVKWRGCSRLMLLKLSHLPEHRSEEVCLRSYAQLVKEIRESTQIVLAGSRVRALGGAER